MIECHSLAPPDLARFLDRQKAGFSLKSEMELDFILREILRKAYEFVPSESGSILLDDPYRKTADRGKNDLVFIATFGPGSKDLLGNRLSAANGIAGRIYQTGRSYLSENVSQDQFFYADIDTKTGFKTQSIVGVPVYIGKNVCGVLELINRREDKTFTEREMTLLEIFAGYTSFMLQNALDAKRAHELAKRDDLTGLYNDRWFHVRLAEELDHARTTGNECSLLFMDLDNFKKVNDLYGHLAGSQVLREVGFLLKRALQEVETAVVSRYGGDEFVMILPGVGLQDAREIAEHIRQEVQNEVFLARDYGYGLGAINLERVISASIGLAAHTPRADFNSEAERNDLLRRADQSMYAAKAEGKNRVKVADQALEIPWPRMFTGSE
ncbi:MAG TPA: sensor domain-containing diguanylate cyclase [Thermoanaerobaculia bacterium]|nr:sensor domain-containing diguanylate cyclase [Thermoanaerobaculia bacterium]